MEIVDLADRSMGGPDGAPVILLLHGLLGSSRNWQTVGRKLADSFRVVALDLRNHGASAHNRRMDYPAMAADVLAWMDKSGVEQLHLVGHSMGGKVSMYLACHHPERIQSLTVVDIAPHAYPPRWEREFAAMRRMPVHHFQKRQEAEEWLEKDISDWAFRKFLVSNLERDPSGGFRWIVNLGILESALPNLFRQIPEPGQSYEGPVLFLRGSKSKFVSDADIRMIEGFFPKAKLVTVEGAGHNVHFDQTDRFIESVSQFIIRKDGE
jgi:pimeloyl-ACP methyl ester carboxylesterase